MIHSYAARIYLFMFDNALSFDDAFMWVCRKCPRNFRRYYRDSLALMIHWEQFGV